MYAKAKAAAANAAAKAARGYAEAKDKYAASTNQPTQGARTPDRDGDRGGNNSSSDPFNGLAPPPSYDVATAGGASADAPAPTVNLDDLLSGGAAPANDDPGMTTVPLGADDGITSSTTGATNVSAKCQTCGKGFSAFSAGQNVKRQCLACKATFCREHVEYMCAGCREGPGGEELRRETTALAAKLASVTEEKAMLEQWRQTANETQRAMVEEADAARRAAEDAETRLAAAQSRATAAEERAAHMEEAAAMAEAKADSLAMADQTHVTLDGSTMLDPGGATAMVAAQAAEEAAALARSEADVANAARVQAEAAVEEAGCEDRGARSRRRHRRVIG
jgi:hypothetical protein